VGTCTPINASAAASQGSAYGVREEHHQKGDKQQLGDEPFFRPAGHKIEVEPTNEEGREKKAGQPNRRPIDGQPAEGEEDHADQEGNHVAGNEAFPEWMQPEQGQPRPRVTPSEARWRKSRGKNPSAAKKGPRRQERAHDTDQRE
jgi:hypothetical protein